MLERSLRKAFGLVVSGCVANRLRTVFDIRRRGMESILRRLPLSELSGKQFDVIVVGGGITGAGVAQDAASRGL